MCVIAPSGLGFTIAWVLLVALADRAGFNQAAFILVGLYCAAALVFAAWRSEAGFRPFMVPPEFVEFASGLWGLQHFSDRGPISACTGPGSRRCGPVCPS